MDEEEQIEAEMLAAVEEQPEEQPEEQTPEEQTEEQTPEEQAHILGWRPQEEYKGTKDWVDASTFLKGRNENLAIARRDVKRLEEVNRDLTKRDKRSREMIGQLKDFEQRAYARAIRDLELRHQEAVEVADHGAAAAAVAEMRELDRSAAESSQPAEEPEQFQREFNEWKSDNKWYIKDANRRLFADDQAGEMGPAEDWPDGRLDYLQEITRRVESEFPAPAAARKINPVNGGGNRQAPKGGKKVSYADLAPEEKQMAIQMEQAGVMGRDEYAQQLLAEG